MQERIFLYWTTSKYQKCPALVICAYHMLILPRSCRCDLPDEFREKGFRRGTLKPNKPSDHDSCLDTHTHWRILQLTFTVCVTGPVNLIDTGGLRKQILHTGKVTHASCAMQAAKSSSCSFIPRRVFFFHPPVKAIHYSCPSRRINSVHQVGQELTEERLQKSAKKNIGCLKRGRSL